MENKPYISFVIGARNDNYGGNFLHRMKIFGKVLLELCEKYHLESELVIVDWNSPKDSQPFPNVLSWPPGNKFVKIRFIEVGPEIHNLIPKSEKMPMFEFIAKNVGVRRAAGEFILATNPDIIFSEEIIGFLSEKKLSKKCFYRADRYDLKKDLPLGLGTCQYLDFCKKNWKEVRTKEGDLKRDFPYLNYGYLLSLLSRIKAKFIYDPRPAVHTNASGDFFLMEKEEWFKLRGYPEISIPCFLDSYICFMAVSSGLTQVILSKEKKIYHQFHGSYVNRANFTNEYSEFKKKSKEMMSLKKAIISNDENWGLGQMNLKDYYLN